MRENYFKSFFKAFGLISVLIAIAGVCAIGYLSIYRHISSATVSRIIAAGLFSVGAGFALLGLSTMKSEKINLVDFMVSVYLVAGFAIAIACFATKTVHKNYGIAYFILAGVCLIETVVRFIKCRGESDRSYKNYYGAIAGKYNPLFMLICGVAIAFVVMILAKTVTGDNFFANIFAKTDKYKVFIIGITGIIAALTVLSSMLDKDTEVTIFDCLLGVGFVAAVSISLFVVPTHIVSNAFKKYILLFAVSLGGCLFLRSLTYSKEKSYADSTHKIRAYYKSVYDKYDVVLPILCAIVVFALLGCAVAGANADKTYYLTYRFLIGYGKNPFSDTVQLVYTILAIVGLIAGVVLTLVYRKFKSQEIVRTDKILVFLLFASTIMFLYEIVGLAFFGATMAVTNLLGLIFSVIIFIYAAIVQFIRLRNYDPIASYVAAQPYEPVKEEENKEEEEAPQEEEIVEEEVQEEEPAEEDPFGLTEEDEAIYESVYGKDEEEEVVEEEPQEEVVEETAEEVVEEAPAEEEVEAEDEAEEEEEEETEAEEEEVSGEEFEGEEVPFEEAKKESNIVIQDFQVVDENGEPKKIKRRFNTKMMFAPYETKEYYNEIKNYLTMYRAKGRYSARCETFRYKGLVAKVALGGKSLKVFLALDTAIIEENPKYHLKDYSEKKQYQEVPVMIRVRSPRSLKYFKELVDFMMAGRGVKPKRNFEPTDYMPNLIPNGEAILASLGMSTYYLQDTMNAKGIPDEMPDNLEDYIPMIAGEPLEEEEVEANVYLDTLCQHFEEGAEVTIDVLKSLHIVTRGNVIHIKARGTLDRKLIIYAEKFDSDALKMLMCTNCTAIKVVR